MRTALRIRRWSFICPYLLNCISFYHKGHDVVSVGGLTIQRKVYRYISSIKVRQDSSTVVVKGTVMGMMRDLLRTEVTREPSPKKRKGKQKTR